MTPEEFAAKKYTISLTRVPSDPSKPDCHGCVFAYIEDFTQKCCCPSEVIEDFACGEGIWIRTL